jgi:GTPase SAR1 family protein
METLSWEIKKELRRVQDNKLSELTLNELYFVPSAILDLNHVTSLRLSGQFDTIPHGIGNMHQLKQLEISGNFENIPSELGKLENLNWLIMQGRFRKIPKEINALQQLTVLGLSGYFREIPIAQSNLQSLNWLILIGLYSDIPLMITQFKNLNWLHLRGHFPEILPELKELNSLTKLELYGNYRSIPVALSYLHDLVRLELGGEFSKIPPELGKLEELKNLRLHGKFTTIPREIRKLHKLVSMDLRGNFQRLPPEIGELNHLSKLRVDSSKAIISPPPEISGINRSGNVDLIAVRRYFKQLLKEDVSYLYEAKILIVGEPGAGKTSLAKKLMEPQYDLLLNEPSTEGINVLKWEFVFDDKLLKVNIWDFGGQEIYHATHQFFLTKRSLYIVVADTRKEDTDFNYWLNIVELLGGNSPLIIVKNEKQDRKRPINEKHLRGQFQNLKEILATNLADNRGLTNIITWIKYNTGQLPHIGVPLPKSWIDIRSLLEKDRRNYIELTEYISMCEQNGLYEPEYQNQVLSYLHDLGVCLHFADDPLLKRIVILKPEWGTVAVYRVLDSPLVIDNSGHFTKNDLNIIWSGEQYSDKQDELLQLMMKFQLCYRLPVYQELVSDDYTSDDVINRYEQSTSQLDTRGQDSFIVPQLLNDNQPDFDWDYKDNLIIDYRYDFMPKGIITRFIVVMHQNIRDNLVWKSGVVLKREGFIEQSKDRSAERSKKNTSKLVKPDKKSKEVLSFIDQEAPSEDALIEREKVSIRWQTHATIIEYYNQRRLRIHISGNDKKTFLAIIMHELEKIHSSFHNLKYNIQIPCNCSQCSKGQAPYFFDYQELKQFDKDNKLIQCRLSYELISPKSLLDDSLPNEVNLNNLISSPKSHDVSAQTNEITFQIENMFVQQGNGNMQRKQDKSSIKTGNIQGGNINLGGNQKIKGNTQVKFNLEGLQEVPSNNIKIELSELFKELETELQKTPNLEPEDAEAIAQLANQAIELSKDEKPNSTLLRITGDGLKKAAENLLSVAPIAAKIAMKLLQLG